MKFVRMQVTGFKSFVEPVQLDFEEGLTAIVGPNGCGKSNLADALRWAMGENAARQMRSGEMDDVIFSGTVDRPPRNLAEVILTLDNSTRGAPAQFNDSDELSVARRIERGRGSTYSVNGNEVRARDVTTLFADASTGAKSTGLVSQGRIGAIVSAKPADRRRLLEEAAGISGMHARRHEAELRLRAAEGNLERLEDVIGALEEQHRALKRQARQAVRFRKLSEDITRYEAIIQYLRWDEAQEQRQQAVAALSKINAEVEEFTRAVAAATSAEAEMASTLPEQQAREAEAAETYHRLSASVTYLNNEEQRIRNRCSEIETLLAQIEIDMGRECEQRDSAGNMVAQLVEEHDRIETAQTEGVESLQQAKSQLGLAESAVSRDEDALNEQTRSLVANETRSTNLQRQVEDFGERRERLVRRREDMRQDRVQAEAEANDHGALDDARQHAESVGAEMESAEQALAEAEERTTVARSEELLDREAHRTADNLATRLEAEKETLSELLVVGNRDLWPPMIDAVEVDPGYEVALGAALGEDLIAPMDEAAPVHWGTLPPPASPPGLPGSTRSLASHVKAPEALRRRLSQIGVVEDDKGAALQIALQQGQRLVSKNGALWRWDGYTAAAGAPTAAATRLSQRNRLEEMLGKLDNARRDARDARDRHQEREAELETAVEAESEARQAVREADTALKDARETLSALGERTAEARSRVQALAEADAQLVSDISELDDQESTARAELETLSGIAAQRVFVEERQRELTENRLRLAEIRSAFERLHQEDSNRNLRLEAIRSEKTSWQRQITNASRQLETLQERKRVASGELDKLGTRPTEIEHERSELMERMEAAETRRREEADRVAQAETRRRELAETLRDHQTRLAGTREERVRRQSAVELVDQTLGGITEVVRDRLQCRPQDLLDRIGVETADELPSMTNATTLLERLQRERENIGPVNLRVEQELAEIDEKIRGMVADQEDLVAAISKLRRGISELNRESRDRLLKAFERAQEHFRDLFGRLFGGGSARLQLTDDSDPLEAGLEVLASPPGKRLQNMSLLSGGEQALTGLALLFAVFLTNPAPICVLDEVDAPLDDSNVDRFCTLLEDLAGRVETRFLLITHHRLTMARMDRLYGVTMSEAGISQLVSVDLQTADRLRETA